MNNKLKAIRKPIYLFYISTALLLTTSCSLIMESDISDYEVNLIAPSDSINTSVYTITFWWDYVPDAEKYNLQIVSPGWDIVDVLVADTNLSQNKFTITLMPGEYDWGVSAYNNSSSTGYFKHHIVIDSSLNLGTQKVSLKLPAGDLSTNKTEINFSWLPININTEVITYRLIIREDSWQGSDVIQPQYLTETEYSSIFEDGKYYWGVQAINDLSSTPFDPRMFIVDTKAPSDIPVITYPASYGDTLDSGNLTIKWRRNDELTSESVVRDSIYISTDSLFTTDHIKVSEIAVGKSYSLEGFANNIYYCKVRSFDAAGNRGPITDYKKFYIHEE